MKVLITAGFILAVLTMYKQAEAAGPCHVGELFVCLPYCLVVEGSRAEHGGCPVIEEENEES